MNELELLPLELASCSLSSNEIVLPYVEALKAIEHLVTGDYFVFAWEGWIKLPDGRHGHSAEHQGTCEFWGIPEHPVPERIREAARFARETIEQAQQQWNEEPEVAEAQLYFCLYVEGS